MVMPYQVRCQILMGDLLDAEMVRLEAVVIETLLVQPLADWPRLGSNNCTSFIRAGRFFGRGFAHDSIGSAAGVSTAASVARVWPVGAAARAAFWDSARR